MNKISSVQNLIKMLELESFTVIMNEGINDDFIFFIIALSYKNNAIALRLPISNEDLFIKKKFRLKKDHLTRQKFCANYFV